MTAIAVTAGQISANEERGAVLQRLVANVTLSIGQWVYIDANNKLNLAIADSSAHAHAAGIVVPGPSGSVYGETTIPAGQWATFCVGGPVEGFGGLAAGSTPLINGAAYYVDKTTAGSMNDAAPTSAYQFVVATAIGPDTIFVRPGAGAPVSA